MLKYFAIGLVGACALVSPMANAGWSGDQQISELYVHISSVVVKLAVNPTGCTDNSYLTLEPNSSPLFKEMYATLLAAKIAGKPVDVLVDGCGLVQTTHPRILYVRVK